MLSVFKEKWKELITSIWSDDTVNHEEVLGCINVSNIYVADIISLKKELNDQIINSYVNIISLGLDSVKLMAASVDSFVLTDLLSSKRKRGLFNRKEEVSKHDVLFGCVNERSHWVAIILDTRKKNIIYMDPLNSDYIHTRRMKLHLRNFNLFSKSKGLGEWNLEVPESHPIQDDGISCGIFCLKFLERYLKGRNFKASFNVTAERLMVGRSIIEGLKPKGSASCYLCCRTPASLRQCSVCCRTFHCTCMSELKCNLCSLLKIGGTKRKTLSANQSKEKKSRTGRPKGTKQRSSTEDTGAKQWSSTEEGTKQSTESSTEDTGAKQRSSTEEGTKQSTEDTGAKQRSSTEEGTKQSTESSTEDTGAKQRSSTEEETKQSTESSTEDTGNKQRSSTEEGTKQSTEDTGAKQRSSTEEGTKQSTESSTEDTGAKQRSSTEEGTKQSTEDTGNKQSSSTEEGTKQSTEDTGAKQRSSTEEGTKQRSSTEDTGAKQWSSTEEGTKQSTESSTEDTGAKQRSSTEEGTKQSTEDTGAKQRSSTEEGTKQSTESSTEDTGAKQRSSTEEGTKQRSSTEDTGAKQRSSTEEGTKQSTESSTEDTGTKQRSSTEKEKKEKQKGSKLTKSKDSLSDKQKEMADWSRLLTKEDVLSAQLRVIPSKLAPKRTFQVGAGEHDVVTGAEFSRRVNHPENINSVAVLSQWFNLGHRASDANGRHHTMKEMTRLIELVRVDHSKQPHQYSPFTLLTEGDVNRMALALPKLATMAVTESDIRESLSKNEEIGQTSTQRLAAFENTRLVIDAAQRELAQSDLNLLTHGGISIVKAVLDIVKSVLPSNKGEEEEK